MIKLGVSGVCGRMGRRILEIASCDRDFEIMLALERKGIPQIGREFGKLKISSNPDGMFLIDVFVDFSAPEASIANLEYAVKYNKALVLGTTGLTEEQIAKVRRASDSIPLVYSPNMSVGVNVLFSVLADISRKLGRDYKVEIVEAHHDGKKDAPSGTAKKMQEVISAAGSSNPPVHSVRLGDIVGDHTVIFCGNSERIEIKHQAHTRDLFALGALKAAKWAAGQKPGLYSMKDVLGL